MVTVFEMSVMIINALVFRKTGKWESRSARGSTNMGAHFTALYTVFSPLKYRLLIIVYLLINVRVCRKKISILIKFFYH